MLKLKKNKFYRHKSPIFFEDIDIEKVFVSNKIYSAEKSYKYFIAYLYNNHKVKPLHIVLAKRRAYVKRYDKETKWMNFLIKNDD